MLRLLILTVMMLSVWVCSCALSSSYSVEKAVTQVKFRVGLENHTVVDGSLDLPANVDVTIGSDVVAMIMDGFIEGKIVRGIAESVDAVWRWIWGRP